MKKLLLSLFSLAALSVTAQVHFQENFESGLPGTWATYRGTNGAGTAEDWKVIPGGPFGSDSAMGVVYENAGIVTEDWLVTPQITLGATNNRLRFYFGNPTVGDFGSTFDVRVSTTSQTTHASFTTIQTWSETDIPEGSWVLETADLSAYNGQNVYIAFVMTQNNGDSWTLDSVVAETPSCNSPTNLGATSITNSSADLDWFGNDTSYQVRYYPTITAATPIDVVVTDSSFNLTGLLSNSTVTYFVREICGVGDTSLWSSGYSFTTTCASPTLPYTQNFDTDTLAFLPCSWIRENVNGDNIQWGWSTSTSALSGSKILFIGYNATLPMNDWVFSPEFNLTAGASYDVSFSYQTSTFPEDFDVTFGMGQNSTAHTNVIESFNSITESSWVDTTLTFTPSSSGNYSVGIHGKSAANQFRIFIDDFSIEMSPTTGIKNQNELSFTLFPNPTNGLFTIGNIENNSIIEVMDVNGRVLNSFNTTSNREVIDLSNNAKGVYFVTLTSGKAKTTKRVLVK